MAHSTPLPTEILHAITSGLVAEHLHATFTTGRPTLARNPSHQNLGAANEWDAVFTLLSVSRQWHDVTVSLLTTLFCDAEDVAAQSPQQQLSSAMQRIRELDLYYSSLRTTHTPPASDSEPSQLLNRQFQEHYARLASRQTTFDWYTTPEATHALPVLWQPSSSRAIDPFCTRLMQSAIEKITLQTCLDGFERALSLMNALNCFVLTIRGDIDVGWYVRIPELFRRFCAFENDARMVVQDFAKCWDTMSATLPVGVHMFKPSDPVELLAEIDDQFLLDSARMQLAGNDAMTLDVEKDPVFKEIRRRVQDIWDDMQKAFQLGPGSQYLQRWMFVHMMTIAEADKKSSAYDMPLGFHFGI